MGIKVKKEVVKTATASKTAEEIAAKNIESYKEYRKPPRLDDYLDGLVFYTDPTRGGSIISSNTSSGAKYNPPTIIEGIADQSSNLETYRQKLREGIAIDKRRGYTFGSDPDEDEEFRLESPEQQSTPMEASELYSIKTTTSVEINPSNIFKQYQKDKDLFPIFKLLIDFNLINETSNVIIRDWRGHYPDIDIARREYIKNIEGIITNIADFIFHYYSYKLSSEDRIVIGELLTEIYISPTPKLFTVDIDTEEVLSEIISLSKSRNITIDKSLEIIKDIDFHEYRHNNIMVSIGYSSLFHRIFITNSYNLSTTRRPKVGSFYDLINGMLFTEKELSYKQEEEMITINGEQYPRKLFEAITEMDFNAFHSNIKIEYILSKVIADESVAGTEELKLL